MAEWRLGRGWTDRELGRRLVEADRLHRSFDPEAELTPARGWNANRSEAAIARELPGPPVPDGPFRRAWALVESYAFSDPRIVKGHFDRERPLLGRRMILEAQALGLHFLGAVVVGDVLAVDDGTHTACGFRYDTLAGHFEKGYEWFVVTKDHRSGEVRFRIEAAWREGEFPNAWSRLGFRAVGRHYQRAWHRLAYQRLRVMLGSAGLDPVPRGRRLVHEGPSLRVGFVHASGMGRRPSDVDAEEEVSAAARHREIIAMNQDYLEASALSGAMAAAGIGAIAGARAMLAPALLRLVRPDVLGRVPGAAALLRVPALAGGLPLLAVGELVADKTPWIPPRVDPVPLTGRIMVGAWLGAAIVHHRRRRIGAAAGALAAFGAAHLAYRFRRLATRRYGLSNVAAGLVEDAVVTTAGLVLLRRFG